MTNKTHIKKALLSSMVSLVLCFVMLLGTTFAWFTDTATTAVNTIQSGTLKVDIVDTNVPANSLQNQKLDFVDKNESTNILWEPGVTFRTQEFKIANKGNLALKYTMLINGITGDAELIKEIDFSIVDADGNAVSLDTFVGKLDKQTESDILFVQGTMKTTAGNECQGKTITGISIAVKATQDTVEYDSTTSEYDKDATFPEISASTIIVDTTTGAPITSDVTLTTDGEKPVSVTVKAEIIEDITTESPAIKELFLKHEGVTVGNNTVKFNALEVYDQDGNKVDLSGNTTHKLKVSLPVGTIANGTGVNVYHDGELVCTTTVQDGYINYEVYHLCDVEVKARDTDDRKTITTISTNENRVGTTYRQEDKTVSSVNFNHTFNNNNHDGMAIYIRNGANVTLNDVNLTAKTDNNYRQEGIFLYDGSSLTINSGTYEIDGTYGVLIWSQSNTSRNTITINGGKFKSNGNPNGGIIHARSNTDVVINGGFFDASEGNWRVTLQNMASDNAFITVKGGTFVSYNPIEHVPEGYKVTTTQQADGKTWYTVVAE